MQNLFKESKILEKTKSKQFPKETLLNLKILC